MSYQTEKNNGGGGCVIFIVLIMLLLGGVFLYDGEKSAAKNKPQKEIAVEDASSLANYIEAAEKLQLDYKIQNSGDKKKKIIIYLPAK